MKQDKRLIIIGAGGHGKVVSELAVASGLYSEVTFLAPCSPSRHFHAGLKISGDLSPVRSIVSAQNSFFIAIGDNHIRRQLFQSLTQECADIDLVRSAHSIVSPTSRIERGTLIMPKVVINADAQIGKNVIINTGAIVEHDCKVGDHSHLAPGSILTGAASIGCLTTIGAGAVVCPGVRVGDNIILGAGTIATRDLDTSGYYSGAPAKWRKHLLFTPSSPEREEV